VLGVGGYVAVLRRLRIGAFTVDDAITLDADADTARHKLLPMKTAIEEMPTLHATSDEIRRLQNGQSIPAPGDGDVAVVDRSGALVAVGRISQGMLRPEKVIPISTAASGP
jgi:tRNA pseudouridine55 synthase